MNIEKSIEILKEFKKTGFHTLMIKYNEDRIHTNKIIEEAIETLLTAYKKEKALSENHKIAFEKQTENLHEVKEMYEKEKGENVKLRLQDIPLIEGELKAYKDRVNELKQQLEKEKEKNRILESKNIKLCDDNLELIKQNPYDKKLHYKYVETPKIEPQWYEKEE